MKIALLTNGFPPDIDGVGDYTFHLANELQRQGHRVSVICRQKAAIHNSQFDVPVAATVSNWNWRAIKPMRHFIAKHNPDWLLVQYVPNSFHRWAMPIWLPILVWLAKRDGVLVGVTFHEVSIRLQMWPLKYSIVSLTQRLIARLLARLADKSVTSIDYYARQLQAYTNKPIYLIPIGSNIVPVPITDVDRALMRRQLLTDNGPVISTFGIRNQDLLFQIVERLVEQMPDVNVLIVGKLRISESIFPLYRRLQHRVHVTGYLPEAEVYGHLAVSDVFFIPDPVTLNGEGGSSNKSTSLAAGLAAGLPVVGTLGDMNNTLLKQTPGLYLEDASDIPKLVQRLFLLLTSNDLTRKRQLILPFFDQTLSWPAIVNQYNQTFCWIQPTQYDYTNTR